MARFVLKKAAAINSPLLANAAVRNNDRRYLGECSCGRRSLSFTDWRTKRDVDVSA